MLPYFLDWEKNHLSKPLAAPYHRAAFSFFQSLTENYFKVKLL